ncbi:type II secretion system F domain [Desulfurococcaceae archaeon AG1]|nr:type II secretion system F domain [Desulfurococcaceae archaeon AG1]
MAKLRIIDGLDRVFVLLFDRIGLSIVRAFELDRAIVSAMIRTNPRIYGARIVGYTLIALLIGAAIVGVSLLVRPNIAVFVIMVLTGMLLPIAVFSIFITYPVMAMSRRKRLVESELPFFASYISIMARGGVPISKAMETFRKTPLFKGFRLEAQEFFRKLGLFGGDPMTTLEEISSHHPSQIFRDFVLGYVITLRTGGDIVRYLEARVEEFFRKQEDMLRQMIQKLGVYMELYMVTSIVGGLGLLILFTSAGWVQTGRFAAAGYDPTILILFNFVGLPLLSTAIIYGAHTTQSRWGFELRDVIYLALFAAIISPLPYLLVILTTGGYQAFSGIYTKQTILGQVLGVAIALLTVSTPAWIAYRRAAKGLRALERYVALYIENVSGLRKTGLPPERCFIEAAKKEHGPLNPVVRRLAAAIEMGIDMEEAAKRSLYGVRSWLVRVIFRLAIDAVKVGGGSPEIFYLLARYTSSIMEAYERLRTTLRIYVFLPYIGAILFAVTSTIYLSLVIVRPLPVIGGGGIDIATIYRLSLMASLASIMNVWIMGIVAGKISGLSVGEGFKHATILTLIATIIIWIFVQLFLP